MRSPKDHAILAWSLGFKGVAMMALITGSVSAATLNKSAATKQPSNDRAVEGRPTRQPRAKTLFLSLVDAVFIGLRGNPAVRSAYAARASQKFDLKVAEDAFTPHAALIGNAGGQRIAGEAARNVGMSPTVEWVTPLGTVFNFGWDNGATQSKGLGGSSSVASVGFSQPLLRGAGLDVNMAPVRSARIAEDLNRLHLRATVADTVTTIIGAYRMLLRAQESKVLADNATTRAQALVEVNQELIRAGRMAEVEIVQAQADVENQKISALKAEAQVDASRFALAALLDLDLGTNLVARDDLEVAATSIPVEKALRIAFERRPDYLGQLFVVQQAKLGITVANNRLLWDLSLFGAGRFGRQTIQSGALSVPTRVSDATVGLQLTIPLNDLERDQAALHASSSLTGEEIQLKAVHQGVEQQVRTSVSSIDLNWRQLEIARRARSLASDAVDLEKQKLNVGRSSNFQVQTLEANFRSTESQQLNATIDYLNALSTLDQQLGTTLDTWKVALTD